MNGNTTKVDVATYRICSDTQCYTVDLSTISLHVTKRRYCLWLAVKIMQHLMRFIKLTFVNNLRKTRAWSSYCFLMCPLAVPAQCSVIESPNNTTWRSLLFLNCFEALSAIALVFANATSHSSRLCCLGIGIVGLLHKQYYIL